MENPSPPPTKRVKLNSNDGTWTKLVHDEIEKSTSKERAQEIQTQLEALAEAAKAKVYELVKESGDFRGGCLVELVDSNESQDQDLGWNTCSRSISAKFTAGPNRTPFSIDISVDDIEGQETIDIGSELFHVMKEHEDTDKSLEDAASPKDIDDFLVKSGLGLTPRTRITANRTDEKDEAVLKRYAYAEVINEAIVLLGEKYGWEDSCGVALGMGNEEIYDLMGLGY